MNKWRYFISSWSSLDVFIVVVAYINHSLKRTCAPSPSPTESQIFPSQIHSPLPLPSLHSSHGVLTLPSVLHKCSASNIVKILESQLFSQLTYICNFQHPYTHFIMSIQSAVVYDLVVCLWMIWVKVCWCFAEVKVSMCEWCDDLWPGWSTCIQSSFVLLKVTS